MKKNELRLNAIFAISHEMIANNGEDSYYFGAVNNELAVAAFDGCGGSGAKKYNNYSGKTGAYVASRAVCGSIKDWFESSRSDEDITTYIGKSLQICTNYADNTGRMLGSLGKSFPTTAAILYAQGTKNKLDVTCYWAGDSRCYMLNSDGLHQLTKDDLDVADAMLNLTEDGVMTNVINASSPYQIRCQKFSFNTPCIVFSATDGCFGYLTSPMAFEQLITSALLGSDNLAQWKQNMNTTFGEVAGDDYTISVAVCGYDSFEQMKSSFAARNRYVEAEYLAPDKNPNELWQVYKKEYEKYM